MVGNAAVDRGLAHGLGDRRVNVAVKNVGHELGLDRQARERPRRRALHLEVDDAGPGQQRAAEDARVAEDVVDARAVGRERRAGSKRLVGVDLRLGIGQREDDLAGPDHPRRDESRLAAGRHDDVGLAHDRLQIADLDAPLARVLLRARARVAADDAAHTGVVDERRDAEAGGAQANLADDRLVEPLADLPARCDRGAERHDRRAVDVVVHDRLGQALDQLPLDLEALGRADVLEMNAAEPRRDPHDGLDELVDVLGVDEHRHRADADQLRVEQRLALHHRHARHRADVAQAQHPCPVGADGDAAPDHREARGELGKLGDRRRDPRDARRVDVAHVLVGVDLAPRDDVELAAVVGDEGAVVEPDHPDARQRAKRRGEGFRVRLVAQLDGDVAQRLVARDGDRRDVADQASLRGDRAGDLGQLPRRVRDAQTVGAVHGHGVDAIPSRDRACGSEGRAPPTPAQHGKSKAPAAPAPSSDFTPGTATLTIPRTTTAP